MIYLYHNYCGLICIHITKLNSLFCTFFIVFSNLFNIIFKFNNFHSSMIEAPLLFKCHI